MKANINVGKARGFFSCYVYSGEKAEDGSNEVVEKRITSCNIITDQGLTFIAQAGDLHTGKRVRVGTGTVEIVAGDTSLGNSIAQSDNTPTTTPAQVLDNEDGTGVFHYTYSASFPIGTFSGQALSEVGLFSSTSASSMLAGQLIKDESDNPTTVTVTASEQLVVEYTIELTVPNEAFIADTGSIDVNGSPVSCNFWCPEYKASQQQNYGPFGVARYGNISLNTSAQGSISQTYVGTRTDTTITPGVVELSLPEALIPPGTGTSTDIKFIVIGDSDSGQGRSYDLPSGTFNTCTAYCIIELATPITKAAEDALAVKVTVTKTVTRA